METVKVSKKRKMNKFTKLTIAILIIILIGIAVVFAINLSRPNGEELVNKFETAVNQGDIDTLDSLVKDSKEVKVTKENLRQLVDYAKDEPNYLKETVSIMNAQISIEEKDVKTEIKSKGDYYIIKEDGLFSSYQIYARPYSLTISSDQADTVINVNGDDVLKTKENNLETTVKNLAPGSYIVKASKKYEFAEMDVEKEIHLFEDNKFNKSVSLEVTGKELAIESSVKDISVFVNGKDTGKKALIKQDNLYGNNQDEKNELFGPFSTDGSIKIHGEAKYPWGIVKSEPQIVKEDIESIDVTPNPLTDGHTHKQVINTINDYAKEHIKALVKQDTGGLKSATDSLVKEHATDIQFDKTNEHYWKGKALGTRIDIGNAVFDNIEDQYQISIPVEFHYDKKEYVKGFTDKEPLEEVFENATVIINYDEKAKDWLISEVQSKYFNNEEFNGENIIKTDF